MGCIDPPRARRQNWTLGLLAEIEKMYVANLFNCCLYRNVSKKTGDGDGTHNSIESLNNDHSEPANAT